MQEGVLLCSGVVLAPTLVVTSLSCAYRPSSLGDPDPMVRRASTLFYADVDLTRVCDRGQAWAPLEDGSFAATFGKPLDAALISVYPASDVEHMLVVKKVFASGARSPCTPGLALLELEREIEVSPLAVQLDDVAQDEAVSLAGHCGEGRDDVTHAWPSRVTAIAGEVGTEQVPPSSLLLDRGSLATDIGGAVTSAQTGALVGVISSGSGRACSELDLDGQAFAVRLSAFRSLLFETARAEGIELRVEASTASVPDPGAAACREPPVAR
jgi:hypothetical protein